VAARIKVVLLTGGGAGRLEESASAGGKSPAVADALLTGTKRRLLKLNLRPRLRTQLRLQASRQRLRTKEWRSRRTCGLIPTCAG